MKHLNSITYYLTEGKNIADVYHFTTLDALINIAQKGLKFSFRSFERERQESGWRNRLSARNNTYTKYISTSRHKTIGKVLSEDRELAVRITLDASAISNNYKIVPIDFMAQVRDKSSNSKIDGDYGIISSVAANSFEERIISSKNDEIIEYLPLKYVKMIDVFMLDEKRTYNKGVDEVTQYLRGLPHKIHLTYPANTAKYASSYNAYNIKFEDNLTSKKVAPAHMAIINQLIADIQKRVKNKNIKTVVSLLGTNSYFIRIEADIPYYTVGFSSRESRLFSCLLNYGLVKQPKYDYDVIKEFIELNNKAYFVDNYMNDSVEIYVNKEEKVSFNYEVNNKIVSITNLTIKDSTVFKDNMLADIIDSIVPRYAYVILPDALALFISTINFKEYPDLEIDEANPFKINNTGKMYDSY